MKDNLERNRAFVGCLQALKFWKSLHLSRIPVKKVSRVERPSIRKKSQRGGAAPKANFSAPIFLTFRPA
jgi:hypothetical protein